MKRWIHLVLQGAAVVGQGALTYGVLPAKVSPWVAIGLAVAQGVTGAVAHSSNPDGSPATTAYRPKP